MIKRRSLPLYVLHGVGQGGTDALTIYGSGGDNAVSVPSVTAVY